MRAEAAKKALGADCVIAYTAAATIASPQSCLLRSTLKKMRVEILMCFRAIVSFHLDEMLKKSDNLELVEKVLAIYNMALTDHIFVLDYQKQYKVEKDLELMRQACHTM